MPASSIRMTSTIFSKRPSSSGMMFCRGSRPIIPTFIPNHNVTTEHPWNIASLEPPDFLSPS